MNSVTFEEAETLLSKPLICEDIGDWHYHRLQSSLAKMECGLMSEDRTRAGLIVQLQFARSPKTKLPEYKFSVFKWSLYATQGVYQLQMNGVARAPKNWHDYAHEHMGMTRIDGKVEWLEWEFEQALDYFCHRTNITFLPPVESPETFRLTP